MKLILPLLLLITSSCFAQSSDFLILKKKNKTQARYFAGNNISFTTTTGAFMEAQINQIKNDTLYLQEFLIQRLPTTLGTYITDTIGSYHHKYHYNQIAAIGKSKRQNFDWRGSGAALMGGGALLALGSGVVYLADREKFSAPLLLSAIGLGTLGYFMAKGRSDGLVIGKKYQLVYMNMQNKKPGE
jgi:hypothetical protein